MVVLGSDVPLGGVPRTGINSNSQVPPYTTTLLPSCLLFKNVGCSAKKLKGRGGELNERGKGEGPRANWEKVQVLRICRGVGVFPSRVIRDEYRI